MKTILLLEDNDERIAGFKSAVRELGEDWQLHIWHDAPTMIAECENCFDDVHLISLDHDLDPQPGATFDPGTGLEVAKLLAGHFPICPVIIHSTNADRAWSMHNELRFAGWTVDRVGPIGDDWIRKLWLPKVREMLGQLPRSEFFQRSSDHSERMQRALLSLEGLAIGDAIGEMLAYRHADAARIIERGLPAGPWFHTDDTEMALSIVDTLKLYGHIHQDELARRFAWRFEREPDRGYGSMTRKQMNEITRGGDWRQGATSAFGSQGSMGNGGAMRVAPLGAYFANDLSRAVEQARASSLVTHTHPEGVAGTIAIAIAAAKAWQLREADSAERVVRLFEAVLEHTPESKVRRGLLIASQTPTTVPVEAVAKALGNGTLVTAPDTVPFAVWCAANHLDNYTEAITLTISAGGDCDTNAAIVGGIVALSVGRERIPAEWRKEKEPLLLIPNA
ncbi:MAG: ADP-ribosylglycohydrolase family protein [Verrucomicrobiota bacterium]|jgi:ADP-ribosylglycohydrolase